MRISPIAPHSPRHALHASTVCTRSAHIAPTAQDGCPLELGRCPSSCIQGISSVRVDLLCISSCNCSATYRDSVRLILQGRVEWRVGAEIDSSSSLAKEGKKMQRHSRSLSLLHAPLFCAFSQGTWHVPPSTSLSLLQLLLVPARTALQSALDVHSAGWPRRWTASMQLTAQSTMTD